MKHLTGWLLWGVLAVSGLVLAALPGRAEPPGRASDHGHGPGKVYVIRLAGESINPATAEYICRAVDRASAARAACLVIELDTPGGLLSSTRSIVKKMLADPLPIVVYVAPAGARAGSAGVFISYAAHVLAMAPSTHIGAAHPVQMGGGFSPGQDKGCAPSRRASPSRGEGGKGEEGIMERKALQDTLAFMRAIAKVRGRNVEWGQAAVRESASLSADEALKAGVADLIVPDRAGLLEALDGRAVSLGERQVRLATAGTAVTVLEMDFRQRFLNFLADPNLAYLLLMLGFYGLLFEVTHPGIGAPGVLGLMFLILAFFGLQMLPVNYAALALMALGALLFAAEVMAPGIGLLTLGGLVCLVLGSLMLFEAPGDLMRVSWGLIGAFSAATAAITILLVRAAFSSHRAPQVTGAEGLVGESGTAEQGLRPGRKGTILIHGERWSAVSRKAVRRGGPVRVTTRKGMTLQVEPMGKERMK